MRQIMGCPRSWEKTRLVKKLKGAWDRKRVNGKVEGRKSHTEKRPETVAMAKRLHRARAIELQKISKVLAEPDASTSGTSHSTQRASGV
jgi:hypothetical protein